MSKSMAMLWLIVNEKIEIEVGCATSLVLDSSQLRIKLRFPGRRYLISHRRGRTDTMHKQCILTSSH